MACWLLSEFLLLSPFGLASRWESPLFQPSPPVLLWLLRAQVEKSLGPVVHFRTLAPAKSARVEVPAQFEPMELRLVPDCWWRIAELWWLSG